MRRICCLLMLFVLLAAPAFAQKEELAHYLLLGVDGWGLSEEGGARSDAIVLVSLDEAENRIVLTSFARDSLVKPSYRRNHVKINTLVRSARGEPAVMDYLQEVFDIPIEGYFVVNFSGAVDIVNAVGGVDIVLTQKEADYLRHWAGEYEGYPLHEGMCRLNGGQALYYMRCRSLDNDYGRQKRQTRVFAAILDEIKGLSLLEAARLIDDVCGMYRTDLTVMEQMQLVSRAWPMRSAHLEMHSLPEPGTYRYGKDENGTSGILFEEEENREKLYRWLGIEQDDDAAEPNKTN